MADAPHSLPDGVLQARRHAVVRAHIDAEMRADVDGVLATFTGAAEYDIVPLPALTLGDEAVRELLGHLLGAFPDLGLHVIVLRHATDAVIIEGRMTGTHRGPYAGHPPSNRTLDLRAAIFFSFDGDRLLRETVYYDELTLRAQIGAIPTAAVAPPGVPPLGD